MSSKRFSVIQAYLAAGSVNYTDFCPDEDSKLVFDSAENRVVYLEIPDYQEYVSLGDELRVLVEELNRLAGSVRYKIVGYDLAAFAEAGLEVPSDFDAARAEAEEQRYGSSTCLVDALKSEIVFRDYPFAPEDKTLARDHSWFVDELNELATNV